MGKNYTETNYRKTYDGEYVKSYGDRQEMKRVYNEGTKSYNKEEKGKYDGLLVDKSSTIDVLDQTKKSIVPKTSTKNQNSTSSTSSPVKQKEKAVASENANNSVPVIEVTTPPPYTPQESEKINNPKKTAVRDYEFYRNMVIPPIMPLGNSLYREMNKKEIVDEREARKILGYAEFLPKEQFNIGIFYVIAVVGGFLTSMVGPLAIIIWGIMSKGKNTTIYERKLHIGSLSVTMPATEQEMVKYKKRGQLYLNVGIVIGVIQLIRLIYF